MHRILTIVVWCFLQVEGRHPEIITGSSNNGNFLDNDKWLSTVSQYDKDKYWNKFRDGRPIPSPKSNLKNRKSTTFKPGRCRSPPDAAVSAGNQWYLFLPVREIRTELCQPIAIVLGGYGRQGSPYFSVLISLETSRISPFQLDLFMRRSIQVSKPIGQTQASGEDLLQQMLDAFTFPCATLPEISDGMRGTNQVTLLSDPSKSPTEPICSHMNMYSFHYFPAGS